MNTKTLKNKELLKTLQNFDILDPENKYHRWEIATVWTEGTNVDGCIRHYRTYDEVMLAVGIIEMDYIMIDECLGYVIDFWNVDPTGEEPPIPVTDILTCMF